MAERYMMAVFTDEAHAVAAVRDLAAAGHAPLDVYAPYAVHALERAMGIPRSRLGVVCALAGFLGAGSILFFQYWTSAVDWRLNVGGKPLFSFPAFVPVTFEVGVLLAAVAAVFAFFWRSRLYPGKAPGLVHPRVTDDRFVIVLEEKDAAFDRERVRDLCLRNHAVEIEERPMPTGA